MHKGSGSGRYNDERACHICFDKCRGNTPVKGREEDRLVAFDIEAREVEMADRTSRSDAMSRALIVRLLGPRQVVMRRARSWLGCVVTAGSLPYGRPGPPVF